MSEDDMNLPNGLTCGDCAHWRKCTALIESIEPTSTTCDWAPSRFALNHAKYIALRGEVERLTAELKAAREALARMRKALEWYAEVDHYNDDNAPVIYRPYGYAPDRGYHAREALDASA